jgi:ribosomal protein S7
MQDRLCFLFDFDEGSRITEEALKITEVKVKGKRVVAMEKAIENLGGFCR